MGAQKTEASAQSEFCVMLQREMSFGLNQYLALRMAAITSKQKISFSPCGRIIHICSRLRNPESPLRATCSLQAHMQSRRWNYHHSGHFPDEKTEVKRLNQAHTAKYVKRQNKPRVSSVQFSRSVVSDSLQPHESQHARPPGPSPTPGVHSNSRPSSW